jgi:hypothetical protein
MIMTNCVSVPADLAGWRGAPTATRTRDLLLRMTLLCRLGAADLHVSDRFG